MLGKGIKWEWETFPQYLDAAQRRGIGINLGFLAPLTPFRHFVMGEESMERAATREETAQIKALIKEAVAAGAFGFTTTAIAQHIGYKGRPLACRNANRDEFKAYANALKELGKGAMELALTKSVSVLDDEEYEFLDFLLTESGRPVTWLAVLNRDDQPDACQDTLRKAEPLIRRGGIPQVTCRPLIIQIDLRNPFIFANLPCWNPVFNQPNEAQEKVYRDPGFRNAFRKELERPAVFNGKWERLEVKEVFNPAMKALEGRTVAEIAKERGKDGVDTFLDLALEDDLQNPVHDGAVQRERGAHPGVDQRPARDGGAFGWRRARRYVVRRRVIAPTCSAPGCATAGDDARARDPTTDLGAGRFLRHQEPRTSDGREWRRISSCSITTRSVRPSAARCATICPAADGGS